ncbi:MAG: terminase [Gemmatimonadota bacterium]|nr:MAG: terminase [Gemmatimonadota bacterium]
MSLLLEKTPEECRAWTPPAEIPVAQWCGENVFLPFGGSEVRPYDPWFTPYVVEILNTLTDPTIEEVTFVASTQVGKTALELAIIAWILVMRPSNVLLVMPTEEAAKSILEERIKPMIEATPALSELVTGKKKDWGTSRVTLSNGASIHIGYAGSPTTLASRDLPNVIADECAKWPEFSKDEGNPLRLAVERTRWFPHTKVVVKTSTPKNEADLIWREWLAGDQRSFYVPCPHCGEYQTLEARRIRLRPGFEDVRDSTRIDTERLGHYVCSECDRGIEESQKEEMIYQGVWAPDKCRVVDGLIEGEIPRTKYRSYRINCVYSPLLTFSEIVAEWFQRKDVRSDLMNFVNSWEAKPWVDSRTTVTESALAAIALDYEEGTVHEEGQVLVAGIDVQHGSVYYVVRAYGYREKSWLVEKGRIDVDPSETDLEKVAQYLAEMRWQGEDGDEHQVALAGIDSGDGARTHEIYDTCAQYPYLLVPTKGWQTRQQPFSFSVVQDKGDGKRKIPGSVRLCNFSTDWFKTKISAKIANPPKFGSWHIPAKVAKPYRESLQSEHKITKHNQRGELREKWEVKSGYRDRNHWWDCEVIADLMASVKLAHRLSDIVAERKKRKDPIDPSVEEVPMRHRRRGGEESNWVDTGGDW